MAFSLDNKRYKYENTRRSAKDKQIEHRTNDSSLLEYVLTHGRQLPPRGHDTNPLCWLLSYVVSQILCHRNIYTKIQSIAINRKNKK
jgi:hypothetical protein